MDLKTAALWYAQGPLGWRVFPVGRSKRPLIKEWTERSTRDPLQICAWWREWPDANVGTTTGQSFDVIDLDGPGALQDFEGLLQELDLGDFAPPSSRTGRPEGGWQMFVRPTGLGNKHPAIDHMDYRGKGGYVILPPSIHPSGRRYEWIVKPWEVTPPKLPVRLRVRLWPVRDTQPVVSRPLPPSERTRAESWAWTALDAITDELAAVPAGFGLRNHELNRLGFRAFQLAHLIGEEAVEASLIEACTRNGYAESEPRTMRGTIRSAKRGAALPRWPNDRGATA